MNRKPKILIVDDKVSNIIVMEELLSDLDVDFVRALSGEEAVRKTLEEEFAVVLMDVQMPGMSGFETVELIRKNDNNILLPIIYITAIYNENYYLMKGIKTGAVDFITKPVHPNFFVGKVNIFVNLFRQRQILETEIRRRQKAEDEMKKARDIAQDAANAKQQFLSTMSHEIRTPLNAIVNTITLLQDENPRPDQLENIEILQFSAQNLTVLINDILDFSKIDAGKIDFEEIGFELRGMVRGLQKTLEHQAKDRGIELTTHVAENIPDVVVGDSARLLQILLNLAGNAVKFTDQGHVSVEVIVLEESSEGITLQFSVVDTGIGIAEDKLQNIFESFTQASASTTRQYGGTGLGLTITKKLVELQGGTISVESVVGKGSCFSFVLTFKKGEKERTSDNATSAVSIQSLKGMKVLVVEDNFLNQKIILKVLRKWDIEIDLAENGQIAVDKVRKNKYHLVLMDLHMPVMNGYDASKEIRRLPGEYFQRLPIVALTASAFFQDKEKIFSHGMNGFIIKPFKPLDLYAKIAVYFQ